MNGSITSDVDTLQFCVASALDFKSLWPVVWMGYGRVASEEVRRQLRPETILVSMMHADNEVGTLVPVAEIAEIVRSHGAWMHTDAAGRSVPKIPVDVNP